MEALLLGCIKTKVKTADTQMLIMRRTKYGAWLEKII